MNRPNLLLIVIDTLRADHLGCYGYARNTSPNIDALAQQGVVCENLFAPGIPTQPAFTTIFTGQHPITHQIVSHGGEKQLAPDAPWLPELLQKAGYTTCAADNLAHIKPWFLRGFEFYVDPSFRVATRINVDCETLNARALPWLKAHAHEPFFLFVHYWDPHTPYLPPVRLRDLFYDGDPFDPTNTSLQPLDHQPLGDLWRSTWFKTLARDYVKVHQVHGAHGVHEPHEPMNLEITDAAYIVAMYDSAIRYVDEAIGQLLHALEETGVADDTLVVVTADHGESLTEHDIYFEHHGLYECTVRVPLIARWTNGGLTGGQRVQPWLQQSDLAPTILNAVGAKVPAEMEGKNLLPHLRHVSRFTLHDVIIAEECTWQAKWSIRKGNYKLIVARGPDLHNMPPRELYDLENDPQELINLYDEKRHVAEALEVELEAWIQQQLKRTGQTTDPLLAQGITLGKRWREQGGKL
ncbi:MAG: sulfatase-like hydrolase/transferase [Abditibacteriales bacterium]|nr:sulfatase-like hydrolase/transferase [Abditibacteriales bacterium]MDW8367045.1 sulfatase [Abditibacteriales bacterium]